MAASSKRMLSTLLSDLNDTASSKRPIAHTVAIFDAHQTLRTQPSSLADFIGFIHTSLHSSESRLAGIGLLHTLVSQCTTAVFTQHCSTWIRLLLNGLQSHDPPDIIQSAAEVLSEILEYVAGVSELSREIASCHIGNIITWVISSKPLNYLAAVQVLKSCFQYFPAPCGPFKSKAEKFLLHIFQETHHPSILKASCQVFALLPGLGGAGSNGIKHTESWITQCNNIIGTLHNILSQLYQDIETGIEMYNVPETSVPLGEVLDIEPQRTFLLASQFQIMTMCLKYQISQSFSSVVQMPVESILSIVCRTLSINCKILANKTTTEFVLLSGLLPSLHIDAFNVLESHIKCCSSHLIVHGLVINKAILQTLSWTNAEQPCYGQQHPYSSLRSFCYDVLTTWLSTVGAASGIDVHADKLIEFILQDIQLHQDDTKLEVANITESRKKKKKKKTSFEISGQIVGQQKIYQLANSEVTLAALKGLTVLIQVKGTSLKPTLHRDIHTAIVPLLLDIQQNMHKLPIPYSCAKCRQQLYRVILSCMLSPHPRWPPPLHYAIRVFSCGLQDPNIEVSSFCREAQLVCNSIIHPRVPSLCLPLTLADLPPVQSDTTSNQVHKNTEQVVPSMVTLSAMGDMPGKKGEGDPEPLLVHEDVTHAEVQNEYQKTEEASLVTMAIEAEASDDDKEDKDVKDEDSSNCEEEEEEVEENTNKATKRKHNAEEYVKDEPDAKKVMDSYKIPAISCEKEELHMEDEKDGSDTEAMLATFVDASPDSE
ncbi:proline-, glutamic acid- and leucine-rich protein 1-like [Saccoglossus kowalevskii]|uniref:Proline-, glutamic acid- and leucine-rich protein 1 n=1 Tax=Saccoglossus kowalevskii TaxID=10224 RepID=A0ABM0GKU0_SACKO|nr:PREDICTED: proline-, glutamic acid- and leucine-rich protein 1-like [Saccoglossus kowalevskii]